jgi:NAD(P)-dependent dehydrogenase (short-subunit alcohol dehydrogenase family)
VADERYVAELVSAARDAFGGLDILVNSHGIDLHSELAATALEDVQRIIGSNFVGVFLTMKHAIPVLAARGGGAIVNISSRLGQVAIIGQAVYGATKAAVDQLSRGAAVDLASMRIRVNSVAPGLTETEMIGAWIAGNENPETFREALVSGVPLGRMARPEEIADAVAYLAGPESGYITGTTLTVDGGYTAQ